MTIVINLLGSSNSGKSTTAHGLMYALKKRRALVEFVGEKAKAYAFERRPITCTEQLVISGLQWQDELRLHLKTDYIVTESPLLLSPFYQKKLYGRDTTLKAVLSSMNEARSEGVRYLNVFLSPVNYFEEKGRFQTKDEIHDDAKVLLFQLREWGEEVFLVDDQDEDSRVESILRLLDQYEELHKKAL
jgi:ABC-type dipeptide/oligopeptide/nickel transport system ATPase component